MRSPSEQVSEGQPGTTELPIEPDAEVVQSHPRRQTCSQSLKLMRPLPPQAEGVEQFVVGALHNLADGGHPPPAALDGGESAPPYLESCAPRVRSLLWDDCLARSLET